MRTRIRIGAQASDGSDDQMFTYSIILFVIMMICFDDDKMIHLVVRLRRSKRRRRATSGNCINLNRGAQQRFSQTSLFNCIDVFVPAVYLFSFSLAGFDGVGDTRGRASSGGG